ncbi:MAG: hypothetical protein KKA60_10305 [Proteobacteria bacterium]|nr:hypothetical protein [Pseudomonadota bacterium]
MSTLIPTISTMLSIILFGATTLIIMRRLRKQRPGFVESLSKFRHGRPVTDLVGCLQAYKIYYEKNGLDVVLLSNILSILFVFLVLFWFGLV